MMLVLWLTTNETHPKRLKTMVIPKDMFTNNAIVKDSLPNVAVQILTLALLC